MTRPRGLCRACYTDLVIRAAYPSTSKFANYTARPESDGIPDFYGPAALPRPTAAVQGTEAKLAVLCERAAAGQALFHPDDGAENY